ncbi:GNAT family N-acetyltransferase [Virgibacillus senegalensis]|uniref:GNAT family N-acetyltransferase n=1 Tax=Virgibacillus senegalensis TaxID=1499679 RepID=UPI00069DEDE7|nr:GNAT family N-acetyltransferase [Virgibacillus senegalensis]
MNITIVTNLQEDIKGLAAVYCNVHHPSNPEHHLEIMEERIQKHAGYPGFKAVKAVDEGGSIVGMAYGYTSVPGQFYRSRLEPLLSEEERYKWLESCFEFVELAVDPPFRRQRVGSGLHDALLNGLPHDASVLTTERANYPAKRLYKSRGWVGIKDAIKPIESAPVLTLMGHNQLSRF